MVIAMARVNRPLLGEYTRFGLRKRNIAYLMHRAARAMTLPGLVVAGVTRPFLFRLT